LDELYYYSTESTTMQMCENNKLTTKDNICVCLGKYLSGITNMMQADVLVWQWWSWKRIVNIYITAMFFLFFFFQLFFLLVPNNSVESK